MKKIRYLMIHCSATPEFQDYSEKAIRNWFTSIGWNTPGYRQITHLDGKIRILHEYNHNEWLDSIEITNGAKNWNRETIHLAYIGGVESMKKDDEWIAKDTRTKEQKDSLEAQVKYFTYLYPWIKILGHNQIAPKACPSFNVPEWLSSIEVPQKNIFNQNLMENKLIMCNAYENLFDLNHDDSLTF